LGKYKLSNKRKIVNGIELHQIVSLESFKDVEKGEEGGWIEKITNLDLKSNAWVSGDAQVYGDARVYGDAQVYGNAQVSGDAQVSGNARVSGDCSIVKSPINLINICEFNVTAYNDFIQIGCHLHTIKEWEIIKKSKKYIKECRSEESYKQCVKVYNLVKNTLQGR
jgi:hypothetical protein